MDIQWTSNECPSCLQLTPEILDSGKIHDVFGSRKTCGFWNSQEIPSTSPLKTPNFWPQLPFKETSHTRWASTSFFVELFKKKPINGHTQKPYSSKGFMSHSPICNWILPQVIQFVTCLSLIIGGHQQPLKGSHFHHPNKVTNRLARPPFFAPISGGSHFNSPNKKIVLDHNNKVASSPG